MNALDTIHYGERLGDLLPAAMAIAEDITRDAAGFSIDISLPPDVALPFARALHRAEAELLMEDAASMTGPDVIDRTAEQRGFDALMLVLGGFDAPASAVLAQIEQVEREMCQVPADPLVLPLQTALTAHTAGDRVRPRKDV